MVRLSPVDAVAFIWPVLEVALSRVQEKTGERWSPHFVLSRILSGNAGLFRFTDDGEHRGWLVVERYEQGGGVWMNVWIIEGDSAGNMEECVPLIDKLAQDIGAVTWRCTGRKGWGKALEAYLKPVAVVYERKML